MDHHEAVAHLRGWSERLQSMCDDMARGVMRPSQWDWIVYRPDADAGEAIPTLGARFNSTIATVQEYLRYADAAFEELCNVLPPDVCQHCGSASDLDDAKYDNAIHCWNCGKTQNLHAAHLLESARQRAADSYDDLAKYVRISADAIAAELPTVEPNREAVKQSSFLGLTFNNELRTVSRVVAGERGTVTLTELQWHLFRRMFDAEERGVTKSEIECGYSGELGDALRVQKSALKENLAQLNITIPDRQFRLADISYVS